MKKWKKMFVSLLAVSLLSGLSAISALAAEEPYTYTVTLSAGNKGSINGAEKEVLSDLALGSTVSFDVNSIQVTDSKYYVKGFRLSGRDNLDALANPSFTVNGDMDYVVAYGIKGNMVAYTVNYQDADGNTLAPSGTFYGNIGDKPVVAYQYIENYVPQALAMTRTLSDNEANNVFTFVYTPGAMGTVVETTTTTTTVVAGPAAPAAATPAAPAGTTDAGTTGPAAPEGTADEGTEGGTTEIEDEPTPQELVDLDDEETPASNLKVDEQEKAKKTPIVAGIVMIAGSVTALGALILFLKKRAK